MMLRILGGVSWLILLVLAVRLDGKLSDSKEEIKDLRARLSSAADTDPKVVDELAALKAALSTKNGEIEQLKKQSAQKQEQALQASAKEREALITGIAEILSQTKLSRTELETLLADLPAEDRLQLLEQVTVPMVAAPVSAEEPGNTEVAANTTPGDAPKLLWNPEAETTEEPKKAIAVNEPDTEPATEEPVEVKKEAPKAMTYTVKSGDNLTKIARKFNVNAAQVMKLNGISNANLLRIGQVLKIPQD